MEFYAVDARRFKSIFFQVLSLMVVTVLGSYLLVANGFALLSNFDPYRRFTWPVLLLMVVISLFYTYYQKRQLDGVHQYTEFRDQVPAYERVYRIRLQWHLFSCLVSCLLFVLTARNVFLYFALFDLLFCLLNYPNKLLFRKDLRNEDVTLY